MPKTMQQKIARRIIIQTLPHAFMKSAPILPHTAFSGNFF
ncbi:hypothetical protein Cabys_3838 [Caldithrix abyssi DSM 13497]|uniref:Uncharacterized protein n=1 Tax=Caldithrix abyssi DSM 13497 TaxID=880073 RepID=A0A1J1CD23_CALAY|nr:hypothetical protein Cabys_3838 [Caldithrix abyssi DSM 13497]